MNDRQGDRERSRARRALWASLAFYVLIAFEFLYMASPFAAYFYAVYGPGLDWLERFGGTSWVIQFFLPHIVEETRSVLIDNLEAFGAALFLGGLAAFAVGIVQIYRAKLRRDDAVVSGLYSHIRHPQYLALIVASIGMALIWPRYLVVLMTVTVTFVYVALAKAEERICLRQYPGYADYMRRTGMFLPPRLAPRTGMLLPPRLWPKGALLSGGSSASRLARWMLAYAVALVVALLLAFGLRVHAIASLHAIEADDGVYVSVTALSQETLAAVAEIARSAPQAGPVLKGRTNLLNYVVPVDMYIGEVPMHLPPGAAFGHRIPADHDPARNKVIFTQAQFAGAGLPADGDILWQAINKKALLEVHVDLDAGKVTATYPPPAEPLYGDRQVPVF